jgi:hypothetical protein
MLGMLSGALFLGSSGIRPTLLGQREKLLYADCVRYIWSRVIHGPSVKCV